MAREDIALLVLSLLLVAVSGYAFREPLSAALAKVRAGAGGETVSVFDVAVDRENRQFAYILFDRPLGEGKVDQILDPPPATIEPALGGTWKWKDTNALRFQPSGGFPVASEYRVDLIPERLLKEGQVFSGETEVVVRTDQFWSKGWMWSRSRLSRGRGRWCSGGRSPKPVAVTLQTSWHAPVIGFRAEAVQKEKDERI